MAVVDVVRLVKMLHDDCWFVIGRRVEDDVRPRDFSRVSAEAKEEKAKGSSERDRHFDALARNRTHSSY